MNPILFEDLADVKGILSALSKLESANVKFADSAVAQNERIAKSQQQLIALLSQQREQVAAFRGSKDDFAGLKDGVTQTTKAFKDNDAVLQRNKQLLDLNTASVDAMRKRLRDLKTEYDGLDRTEAKNQARQKAIATEMRQTKTVLDSLAVTTRQAAKAVDVAERSYDKLSRQTAELKRRLRAMPDAFDASTGAINRNNRAAVELQRQIEKNDRALKQADAAMGNYQRNVGNYGSALTGFAGQLTGVTGVVAGVMVAFNAVRVGVGIIQDMERLDASLKAVSRDSADFARSQEFLIALADRLGLEYGTLVGDYKSLKAATRDTVLEGEATEQIFTAVATAGAKLQLSSEEVSGALRALQQMISKGKISAEELRGQLGERLPGAMRLMAEALGVSETKLNKMMEQGELLAVDVLPKFAEQLSKTYSLETGEKINTLSANTARLKNETALLLKELNNSGTVTGFFGSIASGIASVLRAIRTAVHDKDFSFYFQALTGNIFGATLQAGKLAPIKKGAAADSQADYDRKQADARRKAALEEKADIARNEADVARFQKQAVRKRTAEIQELRRQANSATITGEEKDALNKRIREYEKLNAAAKKAERAVSAELKKDKPVKPNDDTELEKIDKQIKSIEATLQTQALQDLKAGRVIEVDPALVAKVQKLKEEYEAIKALQKSIENGTYGKRLQIDTPELSARSAFNGSSTKFGRDEKADLKRAESEARHTAKLNEELQRQSDLIREYAGKREKLEYDLSTELRGIRAGDKDTLRSLLEQQQEAERAGQKERVQLIQDEIARKKELYKEDLAARRAVVDKSIEIGTELVNGLFDLESARNDNRIRALDKQQQYELEMAGNNESAKAAIEKKYDTERKRLQHQQDVAAREQALFNIAVSTAVAAVKALPNVPLSVAIGALGLLQAGLVLSRELPQYAEGKNVSDTYEGLAVAGEAGRELWIRDGQATLVDRPAVINVGRRDQILPNALTERLLRGDYAEGSAIMQRTNLSTRTAQQLQQNRDAYQMTQLARALIGGGTINTAAITSAILKGFDQTQVHQWQVHNGELVDVITKGQTRRVNAQAKRRYK